MIIAVSCVTLIIGFFIGGFFFRKLHDEEVKKLQDKLTSVVSKSADELATAYEKIEQLNKDNRILAKRLKETETNV